MPIKEKLDDTENQNEDDLALAILANYREGMEKQDKQEKQEKPQKSK